MDGGITYSVVALHMKHRYATDLAWSNQPDPVSQMRCCKRLGSPWFRISKHETLNDRITVDLFKTRVTRDRGTWMFVEWAPVSRKIELLMNIEFLVTKENNTPLCNEKSPRSRNRPLCDFRKLEGGFNSQFIFLGVG